MGILKRNYNTTHARLDKRIRAGWSSTIVATGLEGNIGCGAARMRSCTAQRKDLCVRLTGKWMVPLTHHGALFNDDAPDHWVRMCISLPGKLERLPHPSAILVRFGWIGHTPPDLLPSGRCATDPVPGRSEGAFSSAAGSAPPANGSSTNLLGRCVPLIADWNRVLRCAA